jgi:PIF1-like helicase/Helicase
MDFNSLLNIQYDINKIGLCEYKEPPCIEFLNGPAGSGKTYETLKRIKKNKKYAIIGATTGIAAINMDTITINSILGFFNTQTLLDRYLKGKLHQTLEAISLDYNNIGIEEVSMLSDRKGDIIVECLSDINKDKAKKLGLLYIGDFAQLPPVNTPQDPANYLFESKSWQYVNNITRLDKIHRQDNLLFIDALQYARRGDGFNCVLLLEKLGLKFRDKLDEDFDGTTILGINNSVDLYNEKRFNKLESKVIRVSPTRRGKQLHQWDEYIPLEMRFKIGSYVMILSNDTEQWKFVNGDCGLVESYDKNRDEFHIRLKRNNNIIKIPKIRRLNLSEKAPSIGHYSSMFCPEVDPITRQWILGYIEYHPLRLAYASTVHKIQGLTLDKVQINIQDYNFNYPHMIYVALSRARNPDNLIIVGRKQDFVRKIKVDPRVKEWL